MLIKGNLINNTGRYKHIFQRTVYPGEAVDLKVLYALYEEVSGCVFDETFVEWLKTNKIPPADSDLWEFEYETILDVENKPMHEIVNINDTFIEYKKKLSAQDIANLRVRDRPRELLKGVESIPKLRRALTLTYRKKNKQFLCAAIKSRIKYLEKQREKD
jgi:hypothetical protein